MNWSLLTIGKHSWRRTDLRWILRDGQHLDQLRRRLHSLTNPDNQCQGLLSSKRPIFLLGFLFWYIITDQPPLTWVLSPLNKFIYFAQQSYWDWPTWASPKEPSVAMVVWRALESHCSLPLQYSLGHLLRRRWRALVLESTSCARGFQPSVIP